MKCPQCGSKRITNVSDEEQFCLDCDWDNISKLQVVPSLINNLTIHETLITRVSEECNLNREEANILISYAVDELDVGNNSSDRITINRLIEYINNNINSIGWNNYIPDEDHSELRIALTRLGGLRSNCFDNIRNLMSDVQTRVTDNTEDWINNTVGREQNRGHGYFYYSERQKEIISHNHINYALINGEVVEYTEWQVGGRHGSAFDDAAYLGEGEFHHTEFHYPERGR